MLKGVRGSDPGQPRRARRHHRQGLAARHRFPGNRRARSQPGVRHQERTRSPPTCASSSTSTTSRAPAPRPDRRNRHRDEPHHEAEGGRGDRRLRRGRQDRQLGDEEPDQRRLQGRDLSDPPQGRRDHGQQGLQERQGRAGRDRHRGVRDPRQVRRRRADRMRREENSRRGADSVGLCRNRQRRRCRRRSSRSARNTASA